MIKKLILTAGAALLATAGIAYAQAPPVPLAPSLGQNDIQQVIPNGAPQAGNVYATLSQLRAWILGGGSGHVGTPAITACGGGTPTIVGSDFAFTITQGTTATGCVATFSTAFASTPVCVAANQTAPGTSTPAYTVSPTAVTLVTASTSGEIWNVVCVARNGG